MDRDPSQIREEIEVTRAELGDTVDALSYKTDVKARLDDAVASGVDAAKGRVDAMKSAATGAVGSAADAVAGTKDAVARTASQTVSRLADAASLGSVAQDNPLGLVGGAFALGLLTGLWLPVTEQERRAVGPLRDSLVDRAADVANDAVEHGKRVVAETAVAAMKTAVSSAREHGQELVDSATQQQSNA